MGEIGRNILRVSKVCQRPMYPRRTDCHHDKGEHLKHLCVLGMGLETFM